VGASYKRVAPLPSYACITGTSCTYGMYTSSATYTDSPSTGSSFCATIGHEELKGTVVRSPALTADVAAKGECGGVTRCEAYRWMIRVVEV
jgi:hypothetical protein